MNTDFSHSSPDDLLAKFLAGEASAEERQSVELWVAQSEENQLYFDQLQRQWDQLGEVDGADLLKVDAAWDNFQARVKPKTIPLQPKAKKRPLRLWGSIAAVILLLVGLAAVLNIWLNQQPSNTPLITHINDGTETREVLLPDGSMAYLYPEASFTYPEVFAEKERRVNMQGLVFFEVQSNPSHPFFVDASEVEVRVVGTAFQVQTDLPNGEIAVQVQEGKVAVSVPESRINKRIPSKELEKGEQATFSPSKQSLEERSIDDEEVFSWKSPTLKLQNVPLSEAIVKLTEVYKIPFKLGNDQLADCPLFIGEKPASLQNILMIIRNTHPGIKIEEKSNEIIISGTCE